MPDDQKVDFRADLGRRTADLEHVDRNSGRHSFPDRCRDGFGVPEHGFVHDQRTHDPPPQVMDCSPISLFGMKPDRQGTKTFIAAGR